MQDIGYHGIVVGFDLDDTLFRERDFCRSGFRFICSRNRYRVFDSPSYPDEESLGRLCSEMDRELSGGRNPFVPFENFFRPLAEAAGEEWNLQTHISAYRAHTPDSLGMAEGMAALLRELAERGVKMAIITDGRSVTQRRKISALGLEHFIHPDLILISEETGHDKLASKEMFATVVRSFPEAAGFWYVGNNPLKDFYHPNLMGWETFMVPPHLDDVHSGMVPPSPVHEPVHRLSSPLDLLDFIHPQKK